ncbi:MFS transporter [Kribbella sp. NPDC059898]|uniref:MFS transporter n=1 Tax=Kribbella sp. NPDC059898 TaxID=3346995 RepID=UPI0036635F7E
MALFTVASVACALSPNAGSLIAARVVQGLGAALVLSVTMQQGLGLSALGAGLVYAPAAVAFFVFSMVVGRTIPTYGRRVLEVGAIVLAGGYLATGLLLVFGPPITPLLVIPTLMLQSIGGGLVITPALNTVLSRVAPESAGVASGVLSTAQQCGGAPGVAVIAGVVVFLLPNQPVTDPAAARSKRSPVPTGVRRRR